MKLTFHVLLVSVFVWVSCSLSPTAKVLGLTKKSQNHKKRFKFDLKQTFNEVDYSTRNIIQSLSWRNESRHQSHPFQLQSSFPKSIFQIQRMIVDLFKSTFLPVGYPDSVPPEYLQFQIWNTIQDLCSYLRGIMSTRAVLEGLGVGKADVTAVQATMLWIMRDGASMIGGLLFTAFSSANFGQNAKSWRLFADYINNVGITLDLLAPLSQTLFLPLICLSSVFKSLCGIAAGAAGAVISEHWGSLHGNIAEVNSKNGAQHTAVSLLGLLVSIPFASFASRSSRVMWTVYAVLTAVHVASNYFAMRTLRLRSINISRGRLLVAQFMEVVDSLMTTYTSDLSNTHIETLKQMLTGQKSRLFSLEHIARTEPILQLLLPRLVSSGRALTTGVSITDSHGSVQLWASPREVGQNLLRTGALPSSESLDAALQRSLNLGKHYTLFYHGGKTGVVYVCFSDSCAPNALNQLEALVEAQLLLRFRGDVVLAEKASALLIPVLLSTLRSHGWDTQRILLRPRNARAYSVKNS